MQTHCDVVESFYISHGLCVAMTKNQSLKTFIEKEKVEIANYFLISFLSHFFSAFARYAFSLANIAIDH